MIYKCVPTSIHSVLLESRAQGLIKSSDFSGHTYKFNCYLWILPDFQSINEPAEVATPEIPPPLLYTTHLTHLCLTHVCHSEDTHFDFQGTRY